MRRVPRLLTLSAALLGALLGAGCVSSPGEQPTDKQSRLEPWVAHWSNVVERNPKLGLNAVRVGKHLQLRSLHASQRNPVVFEADRSHVMVVIEGQGFLEFEGTDGIKRVPLQPGHAAALPSGGARVTGVGGELWALVATPTSPDSSSTPAVVLPVDELFPQSVVEAPGQIAEAAHQDGVSLHAGGVSRNAGLRRHAHLKHDLIILFLSGEGTLGVGSEAGDTSAKSVGDRQLKRGYVSSPVSERALAFLPAGAPHSFIAEGVDTSLLVMIYGPGFDGKDGFSIPDANNRPKAKVSKK
jgi:mannose-6-phosphate isomerase-like protein (cupin superfamily)